MSISVPGMFKVEVKYDLYATFYVRIKKGTGTKAYCMVFYLVTGSIYECYQYWSKLLCLRSSTRTVKEQI